MAQSDTTQVDRARKLQDLLLKYFEDLLATGTATPTDVSTLTRLLKDNGWTLDPSQLPDALKGMVKLPPVDEALQDDKILSIAEARTRRV